MKTLDRPLDEDERAFADFAEIRDWSAIAGPNNNDSGPKVVRAIVERVTSATDWQPWPLAQGEEIDRAVASWGFTTKRNSTIIVFPGMAFADAKNSGWCAYDIEPGDIADAEAGLDAHWPAHFELARKYFGEPTYVGDDSQPGFLDEWGPGAGSDKRHLATWLLPGAHLRLFSTKPTNSPLTPAVGVSYAVYIN
ncbi:hypothetical protein [Kribbella sp. NPDC000426]|uniref:hypothetical protein n=1 Tax=Kribbella sp. NPDC000426 TaxID=3154255 RepID=UPI0033305F9C